MPHDQADSPKTETPKVEAKDHSIAVGSIEVHGNVEGGIHIGNTFIQKFFNIFKSDSETLEQRNRRILLGHVENAWIKGVLDASLHGAALLDLGIKQDPEAVTKYPWAIKKESTDETLPAGTSMLEIFDSIGMGRSLLILGAPGSGKTTMMLELARQLIAHAREDVTYPIPMVFNLASWTEKLTLADWLAQELNNLYSVPRKTAPDWVKGNKLFLLLDGLDEVRQGSRIKCVEAINAFRKEHGLTSLAVCSRSQDYADLKAKLSFEGAIEVQPLTQKQITEFLNRLGDEMVGIKQALEKDSALREMAETPMFLSTMILAYQDKQDVEILISGDEKTKRKQLFNTYVERMFERPRLKNTIFQKQDILHWLSWLASRMIEYNQIPYFLENMQPQWLSQKKRRYFSLISGLIFGLFLGLSFSLFLSLSFNLFLVLFYGPLFGLFFGLLFGLISELSIWFIDWQRHELNNVKMIGWKGALIFGLFGLIAGLCLGLIYDNDLIVGLVLGLVVGLSGVLFGGLGVGQSEIKMVSGVIWVWKKGLFSGLRAGLIGIVIFGLITGYSMSAGLVGGLIGGLIFGPFIGLIGLVVGGFSTKPLSQTIYPRQEIAFSIKSFFLAFLSNGILSGLILWMIYSWLVGELTSFSPYILAFYFGLFFLGPIFGLRFGGLAAIGHYSLRLVISLNNFFPWRL